MGLYDNYKLSNSTAIPQYEGSAGEDFIKVGQYKQGLYDQNMSIATTINGQADEVSSVLPQDQGAVNELRGETQSKLKAIANSGNYEDAMPQIQQIGQHFANRSREIAAPQQALSEYRKSLTDKEYNLTPDQQNGLLQMSIAGYKGLQKNIRGQYTGTFTGVSIAKNIDVNKKVDEWMKDTAVNKWGKEAETLSDGDGGMWIVKNGIKVEHIDKDKVTGIISNAAANDQEYQAYKNQEAAIAGHKASQVTFSDQAGDGPLKDAALQVMKQTQIPFAKAYSLVVNKATHNQIDNNALSYAIGKYAFNNVETVNGMKDNPYALKDYDKDDPNPISPFISQGADSKLTDDEKDYNKLNTNIVQQKKGLGDIKSQLTGLDNKLKGNLPPSQRTQYESERSALQGQLTNAQSQVNRSQEIVDYSKDRTAQKMGYNDYDDFIKRNADTPKLRSAIQSVYPNGLTTKDGRKVSVDDLIEAATANNIKVNLATTTGPSASAPKTLSTDITLRDGSKVSLPGNSGDKLSDNVNLVLQQADSRVQKFNNQVKDLHSENVKDFAVQSSNISLNDVDRKTISQHIKSNMDGVRFSKPGQIDAVKAPDNFEVMTIGTNGLGSDAKVKVQGLDKDGKPTGDFYDVTMGNSNIGEVISRKLAESADPESRMAADVLSANSGARQLSNMIPGQSMKIGQLRMDNSDNSDPANVSIKVTRNRDKTIAYNLVGEDGHIIKSTSSVGTAGEWISKVKGEGTYYNGGRQSPYDAKSKRTR